MTRVFIGSARLHGLKVFAAGVRPLARPSRRSLSLNRSGWLPPTHLYEARRRARFNRPPTPAVTALPTSRRNGLQRAGADDRDPGWNLCVRRALVVGLISRRPGVRRGRCWRRLGFWLTTGSPVGAGASRSSRDRYRRIAFQEASRRPTRLLRALTVLWLGCTGGRCGGLENPAARAPYRSGGSGVARWPVRAGGRRRRSRTTGRGLPSRGARDGRLLVNDRRGAHRSWSQAAVLLPARPAPLRWPRSPVFTP